MVSGVYGATKRSRSPIVIDSSDDTKSQESNRLLVGIQEHDIAPPPSKRLRSTTPGTRVVEITDDDSPSSTSSGLTKWKRLRDDITKQIFQPPRVSLEETFRRHSIASRPSANSSPDKDSAENETSPDTSTTSHSVSDDAPNIQEIFNIRSQPDDRSPAGAPGPSSRKPKSVIAHGELPHEARQQQQQRPSARRLTPEVRISLSGSNARTSSTQVPKALRETPEIHLRVTQLSDRRSPSKYRAPSVTPQYQSPRPLPRAELSKLQPWDLVVPLAHDPFRYSESDGTPIRFHIDHAEERRKLLEQLKTSTAPVKTRLADINRYFGQTGFSESFRTDLEEIRYQSAASKKTRKVDRTALNLDWGDSQAVKSNGTTTRTELVHPVRQAKQVLTARFNERYNPPLTFANTVNDRRLNGKFQFVDSYIYGPGVRTAGPSKKHSCDCPNGICDPSRCSCLLHSVGDVKSGQTQRVMTYTRRDGLTVLDDAYMANELTPSATHFEISECTDGCSCAESGNCSNRVITKGRTVPLEVFETPKCGFGVRAPVPIVRGQFIDLYLGEVITQSELERRENAKEETASSYIYSLDWFTQQQCYHVDGENFGTAMRFVNHCCKPNARNFTVQTNKGDKHVYYLAFFAIEDIPAGTEICIDYSPQEDVNYLSDEDGGVDGQGEDVEEEEEEEEEEDGRARCYCGAETCRKFLWRSAGRRRRRRKTTKHD